jgi:hypothetical protein
VQDHPSAKRVKCRCGAVLPVPAPAEAVEDSAWEDEVVRAFGAPPARQSPAGESQGPEPASVRPPGHTAAETPPPEPHETGAAPSPSLFRFAEIDFRSLLETDRWRLVFGLLALGYGSVAALVLLGSVGSIAADNPLFGGVWSGLARVGLAAAVAVGGVLTLQKDKNGPVCAGLACVLFCFFPAWGFLPELREALLAGGLLSCLWLGVRYAVPVALIAWCLNEEAERRMRGERNAPD